MSLAAQAATTVVALIAVVAAVSLSRGANRHTGSVRRAYRLFALTALLWGAGAIGQQALASASAGATFQRWNQDDVPLQPLSLVDGEEFDVGGSRWDGVGFGIEGLQAVCQMDRVNASGWGFGFE